MNAIKLLYVDLFCGAGGTTTGVEQATMDGMKCAKVIACVNHDPNAILSHAANHPDTLHFTEDIRTLNLAPLLEHVEKKKREHPDAYVVLWASLECTNFSRAKGGQPRDADSRTLAEHLFRYIETLRPDYIQIENVEEFMSWGELDEEGKPLSKYQGRDYQRWICQVQKYGYDYDWRLLNAADFGACHRRGCPSELLRVLEEQVCRQKREGHALLLRLPGSPFGRGLPPFPRLAANHLQQRPPRHVQASQGHPRALK